MMLVSSALRKISSFAIPLRRQSLVSSSYYFKPSSPSAMMLCQRCSNTTDKAPPANRQMRPRKNNVVSAANKRKQQPEPRNRRQPQGRQKGKPSPIEYARSQKNVSPRLYASMMSNRSNDDDWNVNELEQLLEHFRSECPEATQKETSVVLTAASGAAARAGIPKLAVDSLSQIPLEEFVPSGALRIVLQSASLARCSESAKRILDIIRDRCKLTMADFTSAVQASASNPLDIIRDALDSGLTLDNRAVTVFVLSSSDNGDGELSGRVWKTALEQGRKLDEQALGAYLSALGDFGRGIQALDVANQFKSTMNDISAVSLLTALSHAQMPDEAMKFLREMEKPNQVHINCVIDALSRDGRLDEAVGLLEPSGGAQKGGRDYLAQRSIGWMTILGGAVKYGNVELAEKASKHVMRLSADDGEKASAMTLLSNAYKTAGDESAAKEIHEQRKLAGLWKEPGKSTVLVRNDRFSFVANDLQYIYRNGVLERLQDSMRVRILARLERWRNPCRHSEKLALAFAVELGERDVVLYKNLRMCVDCHESTLEITEMENIEVRHRDQNRWHVMKEGQCSCGGYW